MAGPDDPRGRQHGEDEGCRGQPRHHGPGPRRAAALGDLGAIADGPRRRRRAAPRRPTRGPTRRPAPARRTRTRADGRSPPGRCGAGSPGSCRCGLPALPRHGGQLDADRRHERRPQHQPPVADPPRRSDHDRQQPHGGERDEHHGHVHEERVCGDVKDLVDLHGSPIFRGCETEVCRRVAPNDHPRRCPNESQTTTRRPACSTRRGAASRPPSDPIGHADGRRDEEALVGDGGARRPGPRGVRRR